MYFKLFFATLVTALSSNLEASAMREIINFHGRSGTARSFTTALESSRDKIILKQYTDLSATQKIRRIDTLEKLKILAALEIGKATTDKKRKKAYSKFSTYTNMQLDITNSI